jgi:hypothetical protein
VSDGTLYFCTSAVAGAAVWSSGGSSGANSFPGIAQIIFVDKGTVTGSEDGSVQNPFHTILDAENAAAALVPSATNRVTICIYPGLYDGQRIVTQSDYVSYYGIGGAENVRIQYSSGNICSVSHDHLSIRGITCANGSAANNNYVLYLANATDISITDCVLDGSIRPGSITFYRAGTNEVTFRGCYFNSTVSGWNLADGAYNDIVFFYDCTFRGWHSSYSKLVYYNCDIEAAHAGYVISIYNSEFYGCRIKNQTADQPVIILSADGWKFIGCFIDSSGTAAYAITGAYTGTSSGTVMAQGCQYQVKFYDKTYRTGPAYSCDIHYSAYEAALAAASSSGVLILGVNDASAWGVPLGSNLVVDGQGKYIFNPYSVNGTNVVIRNCFMGRDLVVTGGAQVKFENCVFSNKELEVDSSSTSACILVIERCEFVRTTASQSCLVISDVDPTIYITRSQLRGADSGYAINLAALNPNLTVSYSVLENYVPASSPISNPGAALTMNSFHNAYSSSPFTGNLSNNVATPYDVMDTNVTFKTFVP